MMPRKIVGRLIASLFLVLGCTHARAAIEHGKNPVHATQKKAAAAVKNMARKRAAPSLVIISKIPNDAPDFDYQDRIQQAQALIAKQPVLKDDMQFDKDGKLSHFVWVLAVGQRTGPLTLVRMDETGKNSQGFTVTWPVDNFINTHFRVTKPEGVIVFAQRRPVRSKGSYEEAVYTAYSPEMDTKKMRDAG